MTTNNKDLYDNLLLFRGALTEVSKKTNFPLDSLRKLIRDGKWKNEEVIKVANAVLKQRKKQMQDKLSSIN